MSPLLLRFLPRLLAALVLAGPVPVPIVHEGVGLFAVSAALADDDDGGDGDDDGGGGVGGGSGGSYGGGREGGGGRDRAYGDGGRLLRFLTGDDSRPRVGRQRPRRNAPRPPVIPDRAPNEIVALGLNEADIAALTQAGFAVAERHSLSLTGGELVRLTVPAGNTLEAARALVSARSAEAAVDFNHFYRPEEETADACGGGQCRLARGMIGWPSGEAARECAVSLPIGLVDTAVNESHAAFAGGRVEVVRLSDAELPPSGRQHGTAVAALLAGAPDSRAPGLLPGARLVAVDAFRRVEGRADIASVYDLVRALDLLSGRQVRVVNLSLSGPANLLLERAVAASGQKGVLLVAAAGNEGPRAKPVFPAAYADVVAVTAVDRARKPYRRAAAGDHIEIAAPGVGVWTAASVSGARRKSGTSFAAPFVTAAAAMILSASPELSPAEVGERLFRHVDDIGEPGRDRVFGWGLLNAGRLCSGLRPPAAGAPAAGVLND